MSSLAAARARIGGRLLAWRLGWSSLRRWWQGGGGAAMLQSPRKIVPPPRKFQASSTCVLSNSRTRRSLQDRNLPYAGAFSLTLILTSSPLAFTRALPLMLCSCLGRPSREDAKRHAHPTPDPLPLTLCLLSSTPRALVLSVLSLLIWQARAARAPRSSARCHLMAWARPP